jgi:hypothetical protein
VADDVTADTEDSSVIRTQRRHNNKIIVIDENNITRESEDEGQKANERHKK